MLSKECPVSFQQPLASNLRPNNQWSHQEWLVGCEGSVNIFTPVQWEVSRNFYCENLTEVYVWRHWRTTMSRYPTGNSEHINKFSIKLSDWLAQWLVWVHCYTSGGLEVLAVRHWENLFLYGWFDNKSILYNWLEFELETSTDSH